MKETLYQRELREQHQSRYWDQLTYVSLKDPTTPSNHLEKNEKGESYYRDFTVDEKKRLLAYAMWARRNNFIEYGGNKQDADALTRRSREVPLTEGKVVAIRFKV